MVLVSSFADMMNHIDCWGNALDAFFFMWIFSFPINIWKRTLSLPLDGAFGPPCENRKCVSLFLFSWFHSFGLCLSLHKHNTVLLQSQFLSQEVLALLLCPFQILFQLFRVNSENKKNKTKQPPLHKKTGNWNFHRITLNPYINMGSTTSWH